jgi:hypothetical protein
VSVSKVGIFFVVDDHLLADAVLLEHGDPYGDTIGYGSHYDFWDSLTPKSGIERRFKARAYDAYPRVRVVHFTREKRFVLYSDKCLRRGKLMWVAQQFCVAEPMLPRDEHYQCAVCNPLFVE